MKKVPITLLVLSILFWGFVLLLNPGLFYSETVRCGNLYFTTHKIWNSCVVSYGMWEGMEDSLVVRIPDEINGRRVTALGDAYPNPFLFILDEGISYVCGEEMLPEDAIIVPRYLTIRIGKNLRVLNDIEMKVYYCDQKEPNVFYRILVDIECSGENRDFYSENGRLYRKAGNQLMDVFFYASDYR